VILTAKMAVLRFQRAPRARIGQRAGLRQAGAACKVVADNATTAPGYCRCRHFRVVYTRRGWGGKLIRRWQCRHCGGRMTTWEPPRWGCHPPRAEKRIVYE
jgi:hypothetical protein